jgi:hypothetical protein
LQIRIRMFFEMHASVAKKHFDVDWWVDGHGW